MGPDIFQFPSRCFRRGKLKNGGACELRWKLIFRRLYYVLMVALRGEDYGEIGRGEKLVEKLKCRLLNWFDIVRVRVEFQIFCDFENCLKNESIIKSFHNCCCFCIPFNLKNNQYYMYSSFLRLSRWLKNIYFFESKFRRRSDITYETIDLVNYWNVCSKWIKAFIISSLFFRLAPTRSKEILRFSSLYRDIMGRRHAYKQLPAKSKWNPPTIAINLNADKLYHKPHFI